MRKIILKIKKTNMYGIGITTVAIELLTFAAYALRRPLAWTMGWILAIWIMLVIVILIIKLKDDF